MISKKLNNNRNLETEAKIKKVALEKLRENPDGSFIQSENVPLRTLDKSLAIKTIADMPFDNVLLHFRTATTGKVNLDNIHGWEQDSFQFLHNGWISDYSPKATSNFGYGTATTTLAKDAEHTDSYLLFMDLVKAINDRGRSDKKIIKSIKKVIKNCSFYGRAILVDKLQDKAFLFGDWYSYLADDSYLIVSSHDINLEQEYEVKSHGLRFEYSSKALLENEFEGIILIKNFSQPNFHFQHRGELEEKDTYKDSYTEYTPTPITYKPTTTTYYDDLETEEEYNKYYGQAGDEKRWEEQDKAIGKVNKAVEESFYQPKKEWDINDIPEYKSMNPYDMNTITDETGTHDEYGICCSHGTCWIYDFPYNQQQSLKFPKGELLMEV